MDINTARAELNVMCQGTDRNLIKAGGNLVPKTIPLYETTSKSGASDLISLLDAHR